MLTWHHITYSIRVGGQQQPRRILTAVSGVAGSVQQPVTPPSGDAASFSNRGLEFKSPFFFFFLEAWSNYLATLVADMNDCVL